ncbi:hypothetical protein QBC46DRAFT_449174 [Diplogelasinospora grovesii]|uniref:Uncharacterized protein n=1 Tax=Diplogelasinospora grovesii TaxID=303347 RepID=A0AAN6N7Y6_9PEZI|nr:hypothetical protein QBC46DRAFT_449174 [Diplogelasinospora grovesii]
MHHFLNYQGGSTGALLFHSPSLGKPTRRRQRIEWPWIRSLRRNNTCYDLGSHAEVLLADGLWLRYKRFILMNASVRRAFMPTWANNECWGERILSRVTNEVKSMVWATDSEGLGVSLHPPPTSPRHDEWMEILFSHAEDFPRPADYETSDPDWVEKGLSQCFANRFRAVEVEIAATGIVLGAGKKVDVLLSKYQTSLDHSVARFCEPLGPWDPQGEGAYDGASIHPYETIVIKTNRGISPKTIENLSKWADHR